jgi:histidinol-phosphate aminotransferase
MHQLFEDADAPNIRIGQNENPYGPSPKAQQAMIDAVGKANRYPGDLTVQLRERIAKQFGLSKDHVLLGAGSSELLGQTAAFAASQEGNAVTADPTFRLWFTAAQNFGLTLKKVPLAADKVHDLPAMLKAIDSETRLVYVVNPHNPTGTVVSANALKDFVAEASKSAIVLLDEAYTEYSDEPSLAELVKTNKNLVIAKTFSKIHGMAGARVGFVLAHEATIKQLAPWQPWANAGPSNVGLAGAIASMDDNEFLKSSRQKNDEVKKMVTKALNEMGYPVIPSHTNFFYFNAGAFKGDIGTVMSNANISAIRLFEEGTPWRRTSLGTMKEMERFLQVLKQGA